MKLHYSPSGNNLNQLLKILASEINCILTLQLPTEPIDLRRQLVVMLILLGVKLEVTVEDSTLLRSTTSIDELEG